MENLQNMSSTERREYTILETLTAFNLPVLPKSIENTDFANAIVDEIDRIIDEAKSLKKDYLKSNML